MVLLLVSPLVVAVVVVTLFPQDPDYTVDEIHIRSTTTCQLDAVYPLSIKPN